MENKAFNLFDFGLKKAEKVQLYDENSLDAEGNIIPFETQVAIASHYLQTKGTKYGNPFKKKAQQFMSFWLEWVKERQQEFGIDSCVVAETSALEQFIFQDFIDAPFKPVEKPKFTFIDLFAGIGGFRMALQNLGGKCVFSSEWDTQAARTYFANYGEYPFGDITLESTKQYIPDDFDILCAGFPCQAFSLAGKRLGFAETRGTLFFDVAEILRRKQPKAIFLENVKGLAIHDKGKTLKTILNTLDEVGYIVPEPQIINAMYFGGTHLYRGI